jgi:hypothetical protein
MSKEIRNYIVSFKNFLIKENTSKEYDEILDLYNEVGLEGMSKDEVDFLKSGGQTELPNRFKTKELLNKHKETSKSHEYYQKSQEYYQKGIDEESKVTIQKLKKILKDNPEWKIEYPYDDLPSSWSNFFRILFKDEKLFNELSNVIYGDERLKNQGKIELLKLIYIRDEKDWSKKYNTHRELDEIPGPEYKLAIHIPKNWFEDLF